MIKNRDNNRDNKIIKIDTWNMCCYFVKSIKHHLKKIHEIKRIDLIIFSDLYYEKNDVCEVYKHMDEVNIIINKKEIILERKVDSIFNSINFDSNVFNRGYVFLGLKYKI